MPAITYPTTLPPPSQWQGVPRERRAASGLPGNTQLRNRTRDAMHDIDAQWFYTSAEMTIWRAWYETTLLDGMLWFAATAPGPGGWVQRVAKFRTKTLKLEYVGNGVYRVSAQVQQRGISEAPSFGIDYLLLDNFTGAAGALTGHVPDVAPGGFAWGSTGLLLDGLGQVITTTADASVTEPLSLPVTRPFSIRMTATRPETTSNEAETFTIGGTGLSNAAGVSLVYNGTRSALFLGTYSYPISSGATHTLRLTFNSDGTASGYVDEVIQGVFSFSPVAVIEAVQIYVSGDSTGVTGRISSISVEAL